MKALSIWQPWCTALALGKKRIETRGWKTHVGGTVALHASRTTTGLREMLDEPELWSRVLGVSPQILQRTFEALPFGAVVAVGMLKGCHRVEDLVEMPALHENDELALGDYSPGRWGWHFDRVTLLDEPVAARGHQSLFELDPRVEAAVLAQLPAPRASR